MPQNDAKLAGGLEMQKSSVKGLSVITATVFIVGEVAGGGILSLAFATSQAGWAGLAMIIFCACCAGIAGICLSDSWLILEERYPEYRHGLTRKPLATIGYHSFGKGMSYTLSTLMNVTRMGASTVFLILASDLLQQLLGGMIPWTNCAYIPFVGAFLAVPLWLGSPKHFWPMAYFAMFSTAAGSLLLLGFLISRLARDGFANDHSVKGDFLTYLSGFGTFLFAYGGGSAFPNFQNDMKRKDKFTQAVVFGFIGLLLLYIPTAGLGYALYGNGVQSSIIDNIGTNGLVTAIQICFLVHCLSAVIIIINPVYLDLEEALSIPKSINWKRCVFRTALLALLVFIGETFPNFGQILSLIGSTNVAITSIILPPILYTKLCYDHKNNSNWRARHVPIGVMIVFIIIVLTGAIGGFSSAYVTLINWQPLSSACYMPKASSGSLPNATTTVNPILTTLSK